MIIKSITKIYDIIIFMNRNYIIFTLLLLLISCCSSTKYTERVTNFYDVYDTPIPPLNTVIKITTHNEKTLKKIMPSINNDIEKIHQLTDNYHHYTAISNLQTINQCTQKDFPLTIDESLVDIIQKSIAITKQTKGYFNITIEPLNALWHDKFSPYPLSNSDPSEEDINKSKACIVDYKVIDDYIIIDNNTITIKPLEGCESKIQLNLAAIAKGYASDIIKNTLNKNYLIDVGTSSIVSDGSWNIGVRDFNNHKQSLFTISLHGSWSLSTSGDDTQYFLNEENIRRCHLLNPFSGYSENYYRHVSIITTGPGWLADSLTTAIFNMKDIQEINNLMTSMESIYGCEIHYCLLKENNDMTYTLLTDNTFKQLIQDVSPSIKTIEIGRKQ